ncbi:MAG: 50S ribosomal protein L10 [Candidatus Saccharibacteria bacterium]|nr:50S ribosomal protein L10 [Candidatus Saccharibacteria bacterium]
MALTKDSKQQVVDEVTSLLGSSKMTVVAAYQGTTVKALQQLRRDAKADGTVVKVAKNRLVIKAVQSNETLKDADVSALKGQLIYAFNDTDEVAPAKALAVFAKTNPTIQFVGAISSDGTFMSAADVTALASLPSKNQLIAGIINTLNSPVNGVMSGLTGNLHGLLQAIELKAAN